MFFFLVVEDHTKFDFRLDSDFNISILTIKAFSSSEKLTPRQKLPCLSTVVQTGSFSVLLSTIFPVTELQKKWY